MGNHGLRRAGYRPASSLCCKYTHALSRQANVKRIVQSKLDDLGAADNKKYSVSKDALLALAEGGKVFVHYLTTMASETCKEAKRATISAKDVLEVGG